MWLKKNKESYISILIKEQTFDFFCFEKNQDSFFLKHFEKIDFYTIGIVEGCLHNFSFFENYFYKLCEHHSFTEPVVAMSGALLQVVEFQYDLFFYRINVPFFFCKNSKLRSKINYPEIEGELSLLTNKADLRKALNLWGALNEYR